MPHPQRHIPQLCQRCSRERRDDEYTCPSCGGGVYGSVVVGMVKPPKRVPEDTTTGLLGELVELPRGRVLLCFGKKGSGKTSLLLQGLRRPWVCSSEMAAEELYRYAERLGVELLGVSHPYFVDEVDPETKLPKPNSRRLELDIPATERPTTVLLDSVTRTGDPELALLALRNYCVRFGIAGACTAQVTDDGDPRGPRTLGHDVDAIVRLDVDAQNRTATVEKNRFGAELATTFQLDGQGRLITSRWDRYYSIEGTYPSYRAEPWPSARARYADWLRIAEEGRRLTPAELEERQATPERRPPRPLPKAPCAVAAQSSALYPGGWVEPADVLERAAWAKRQSLPFVRINDDGQ